MRFTKYGHYMHESAMDVCMVVLRTQYKDAKRYKLRVCWMNLGYTGEPWLLGGEQTVTIRSQDVGKWKFISPYINNARTKSGLPEGVI